MTARATRRPLSAIPVAEMTEPEWRLYTRQVDAAVRVDTLRRDLETAERVLARVRAEVAAYESEEEA